MVCGPRNIRCETFQSPRAPFIDIQHQLQAISDLIKAITTLPLEATLLSLPPAPLLELTCIAADRQLTAVWLNLAARLVVQLEPSSFISLKTEPEDMTRQLVTQAAQSIIVSSLRVLQSPTVMNDVSLIFPFHLRAQDFSPAKIRIRILCRPSFHALNQ